MEADPLHSASFISTLYCGQGPCRTVCGFATDPIQNNLKLLYFCIDPSSRYVVSLRLLKWVHFSLCTHSASHAPFLKTAWDNFLAIWRDRSWESKTMWVQHKKKEKKKPSVSHFRLTFHTQDQNPHIKRWRRVESLTFNPWTHPFPIRSYAYTDMSNCITPKQTPPHKGVLCVS